MLLLTQDSLSEDFFIIAITYLSGLSLKFNQKLEIKILSILINSWS